MSKSILISIKPKWAAKILNGEKTIEIRKTMPKCDLPIDVYIYCTKEDSLSLLKTYPKDTYVCEQEFKCDDFPYLCSGYEGKGKVVAKFTLNRVEEIKYQRVFEQNPFHYLEEESGYGTVTLNAIDFKKETCLTDKELEDYLNTDKSNKRAYAIHITKLEIFDKPKELSEFKQPRDSYGKVNWHTSEYYYMELTKAPQSDMFIEV